MLSCDMLGGSLFMFSGSLPMPKVVVLSMILFRDGVIVGFPTRLSNQS
jgi:hypothetical protein